MNEDCYGGHELNTALIARISEGGCCFVEDLVTERQNSRLYEVLRSREMGSVLLNDCDREEPLPEHLFKWFKGKVGASKPQRWLTRLRAAHRLEKSSSSFSVCSPVAGARRWSVPGSLRRGAQEKFKPPKEESRRIRDEEYKGQILGQILRSIVLKNNSPFSSVGGGKSDVVGFNQEIIGNTATYSMHGSPILRRTRDNHEEQRCWGMFLDHTTNKM